MSDIAIRVDHYILSSAEGYILSSAEGYILSADLWSGAEGLSKLYPAVAPRACPECSEGARHLGRAQSRAGDSLRSQRHATLRNALVNALPRIPRISRIGTGEFV